MRPALFLDRDGTLIEDRGYIKNPEDLVFFPDVFANLRQLQKTFRLFIITNQSGIAKGLLTHEEVDEVHKVFRETLRSLGVRIDRLFCCPHDTEDQCLCKKPSPYFIHEAARDFELDLKNSYMIGDHPSDVECGINAGVNPIYLLSGHGQYHLGDLRESVPIYEDFGQAAQHILLTLNKRVKNERSF
jgi:D-glycero-D-manno-heptose 1,7-bisphosphate phosphatase